jgi:hypothetical protein
MEWSGDLYLVALLDSYVGSKPVVAENVRRQLLRNEEEERVLQAVEDRAKGRPDVGDLYGAWTSYTALDFRNPSPALVRAVTNGILPRALFDLMLGQRVKTFKLNRFSEVHTVRNWIVSFFRLWCLEMHPIPDTTKLWWDGMDCSGSTHRCWVSREMNEDGDLFRVVECWLDDSNFLQSQLDNFEALVRLANNQEECVLSKSDAVVFLRWMKVFSSNRYCAGSKI